MTWTLSEFASIAEILGVGAIFSSLIFVGIQLNRSNREARAATNQAVLSSENQFYAIAVEHAATWDKLVKGETLSEGEEQRRAILLFNMLMVDTESRFYQFRAGYLDSESWESRLSVLVYNTEMPIFKIWRDSVGARTRSANFLELIDNIANGTR